MSENVFAADKSVNLLNRTVNFLKKTGMVEFGFYWSVFFAVWGPVPRYLGWLIIIAGLIKNYQKTYRGNLFSGLESKTKIVLVALLVWNGISSFVNEKDLHDFVKGFSMMLEFAFSLWIASIVFRKEGAIKRWALVFAVSIVPPILFTVFRIITEGLSSNPAGPFNGNINSLGLYASLVAPFTLAIVLSLDSRKFVNLFLSGTFFAGVLVMLFTSFSIGPWGSALMGCLVLLFLIRIFSIKIKYLWVFPVVVLFLSIFAFAGQGDYLLKRASGEINQLFSMRTNTDRFLGGRGGLFKGTIEMIKERPVLGWGWSDFGAKFTVYTKNNFPELGKFSHNHAHNMYLDLTVSGGLPTLVLIIFLFCQGISGGIKKGSREGIEPFVRLVYFASVATLISQVFYSIGGNVFDCRYNMAFLFWVMWGINLVNPRDVSLTKNEE